MMDRVVCFYMSPDVDLSSFVEDEAEESRETVDAPEIRKKREVKHPYKSHAIGNLVWVYNRGEGGVEGYYTPRNEDPNLFRRFDSYPITTSIIGKLQYYEVERILVLERETRTIYEYRIEDYLNAPVYEWEHTDENGDVVRVDEQFCPARDDALHTWEDVSPRDLFR